MPAHGRPQLLMVAAEQGARGFDLDVDEREAAAAVPEDAEGALPGLAADLGKLLLECYLEHGESLPIAARGGTQP